MSLLNEVSWFDFMKERTAQQRKAIQQFFNFIPTNQSINQTFLIELNDCWWNEESWLLRCPFAKQIKSIQSINFSLKEKSELISLMICWRCLLAGCTVIIFNQMESSNQLSFLLLNQPQQN